MSSPHSSLLSRPTGTGAVAGGFPWKALLFLTFTLVSILSLASFSFFFPASSDKKVLQISHVCSTSPNPPSCRALLGNVTAPRADPASAFKSLVSHTLRHLDAASAAVAVRSTDDRNPSLDDCSLLIELAGDRVAASAASVAAGANDEARTWMSAALTNYGTCLDGLAGHAGESLLGPHLSPLRSLASAALAVLNAAAGNDDDEVSKPLIGLPSWVPSRDRKLLQNPSSFTAAQADVVVAKDGTGKYKTVQAAVDASPDNGKNRYVIYVKQGIYKENVNIGKKKQNLMLVGDGMDATIITGSRNVVDGDTTFNSATLAAVGDGLILQDLRVENTAGPQKHQAVALRVGADRAVINRCRLDAYQDTLYAHSLRQFYRDCFVSGTVDFIFGNAAVVFQNCRLVARKPMDGQKNAVTAQGREDPNQNTGTSVQSCTLQPATDLAPVKANIPTYLGRPWKAYSRTVFMQSFIDDHVDAKGWLEWDGDFALKTLFYGEYQNRGPGAGTAGRVKWPGYRVITDPNVAKDFTVAGLIQGGSWLAASGVAFNEGL